MYDLEWARRILRKYRNICPRAEQIDRCLIQMQAEAGFSFLLTMHKIEVSLERCIRDKHYSKIWNRYKRLNKTSPFDKRLCEAVAREISYVYLIQRNDAQQILLEFEGPEVVLYDAST